MDRAGGAGPPARLPLDLTDEALAELAEVVAARHDRTGEAGRPDRTETSGQEPLDLRGRVTAAAIPGGRLEVYRAGHDPLFTEAERQNRDLLAVEGVRRVARRSRRAARPVRTRARLPAPRPQPHSSHGTPQ